MPIEDVQLSNIRGVLKGWRYEEKSSRFGESHREKGRHLIPDATMFGRASVLTAFSFGCEGLEDADVEVSFIKEI